MGNSAPSGAPPCPFSHTNADRACDGNICYNVDMQRIGEYDVVGEVGRGGMGTVFRAVHHTRRTEHAVKVFDVANAANRDALAKKFLAEAKLASVVRHPNIVRVTDSGTADDGRPYLVMDFVGEGRTLADRLASCPPSPEEVLRLYGEIRSALACCHEHGIVHADLKAENVLLDHDGQAVLSDFGISRVLDPELRAGLSLATSTLPVNLGTPYALAPECVRGELATPASDVYAFGVLLFKLATGIWYEGSPRLLAQVRELAPEWAPLLARMLADDPARRPADARALPEDPLSARPRTKRLALALAACGLFAAAAAGFVFLRERPGSVQAEPPAIKASDIRGGYVPRAVLTPADTLVLTGAVHFGTVVLPDTNGFVHVRAPKDFSGTLITADHAEGSLYSQFHVDREPGMHVIIVGNHRIEIKRQ